MSSWISVHSPCILDFLEISLTLVRPRPRPCPWVRPIPQVSPVPMIVSTLRNHPHAWAGRASKNSFPAAAASPRRANSSSSKAALLINTNSSYRLVFPLHLSLVNFVQGASRFWSPTPSKEPNTTVSPRTRLITLTNWRDRPRYLLVLVAPTTSNTSTQFPNDDEENVCPLLLSVWQQSQPVAEQLRRELSSQRSTGLLIIITWSYGWQ